MDRKQECQGAKARRAPVCGAHDEHARAARALDAVPQLHELGLGAQRRLVLARAAALGQKRVDLVCGKTKQQAGSGAAA